jgi:hypothetical protein
MYEKSQIGRCIAFAFSITSNINVLNLALNPKNNLNFNFSLIYEFEIY